MIFWVIVSAMAAIALVVVILPSLRRNANDTDDAQKQDQIRRLDELDEDLEAGDIDIGIATGIRQELERAVVNSLPRYETKTPEETPPFLVQLLLLSLFVPLLAITVYLQTGSPHIAEFQVTHSDFDPTKPEASAEMLLSELRRRLADTPDDREGWLLLTRTNMRIGRYVDAVEAAETLYQIAPNDPIAILSLIDALAMVHEGQIVGRARSLIDDVLRIDSENPTAMILKGLVLQQTGDPKGARHWWLQSLEYLEPDSSLRNEVTGMLTLANNELPPATVGQTAPKVQIKARISLDSALSSHVRADDTVFVIARAVDGPKVPLAVSRHTRAQLPLDITLDETMAMVPGMSLADFERVYIVARVSRTGTPQAASGDLEGRSDEILVKSSAGTTVVIDTKIP